MGTKLSHPKANDLSPIEPEMSWEELMTPHVLSWLVTELQQRCGRRTNIELRRYAHGQVLVTSNGPDGRPAKHLINLSEEDAREWASWIARRLNAQPEVTA